MNEKYYSKEALKLHKEANKICCNYNRKEGSCSTCKYNSAPYCSVFTLKDAYSIINTKELTEINIEDYISEKSICILDDYTCDSVSVDYCQKCLIETLLKDKYVKIVKKENSYE